MLEVSRSFDSFLWQAQNYTDTRGSPQKVEKKDLHEETAPDARKVSGSGNSNHKRDYEYVKGDIVSSQLKI